MPCQDINANYPSYIKSLLKEIELLPNNAENNIIKGCTCRLQTPTNEEGCPLVDEDGKLGLFPFCIQYAASLPENFLNPNPWLKLSLKEAMFLYWRAREFDVESFKWTSSCWENKLKDGGKKTVQAERTAVDPDVPGPDQSGWFYNPQNYPNIYPILPYDPKKNVCKHIIDFALENGKELEACFVCGDQECGTQNCSGCGPDKAGANGAWSITGGGEVLIFRFDEAVITKEGNAYFINVPVGSCMEGYRQAAGARRDGDGCDGDVSGDTLVQTVNIPIEFQIDNKKTSNQVGLKFYRHPAAEYDPDDISIGKITVR